MQIDTYAQNIQNINLSYLMLAQKMIQEDKFAAGFRLGITQEVVESLKELSLNQVIKLASTNQLICKIRIDNENVIEHLTKDSRVEALQQIHTGIILSTTLLNSLSNNSDQML
jgi:flagellar transcriptional activator FlhD